MLTDLQTKLYKQNGPVFQCFRLLEEIAEFLIEYDISELADVYITLRYPIKMFQLEKETYDVSDLDTSKVKLYKYLLDIQFLLLKYFRGTITQEQLEKLQTTLIETYYTIEKMLIGWEYLILDSEAKLEKEF